MDVEWNCLMEVAVKVELLGICIWSCQVGLSVKKGFLGGKTPAVQSSERARGNCSNCEMCVTICHTDLCHSGLFP